MGQAVAAAVLICLAAGVVVATSQPVLAVALTATTLLGGITILERQRMAPLLWGAVALTAPLQGVRIAPVLAVSDLLIIAALLTTLPDVLQRGWRRVVPDGVIIAFGLLVSAGLMGTFFAPDVGASLANLVKIVLAAAGSVVAMSLWDPDAARLRRFAWLWFAGATASAMWAAVTPRPFVGRAVGLTNHPNHFGLVCALAIGMGLGLTLSSTGRARVAAVTGIVILTVGVDLSGSRSALLALAVTIAMTAVLTRQFRLLVAAGLTIILGAMATIAGIVNIPDSQALSRLGGGGGSSASDLQRTQLLADAFARIGHHPFTGEGFEFAQVAHNIYVEALVVGGPLALLGFLAVSGLIARAGLLAVHSQRTRRNGPLLAGLTAGYGGYLCSGAFDNILWDRYLWTYIGLLLLLAASARRPDPASGPENLSEDDPAVLQPSDARARARMDRRRLPSGSQDYAATSLPISHRTDSEG